MYDFGFSSYRRDGFMTACKACVNKAQNGDRLVKRVGKRLISLGIVDPEPLPKSNRQIVKGEFRRRLGRYGITTERYEDLLRSQGGLCAVCRDKDSLSLVVDHDHATGRVRGLLCHRCNTAIGFLQDNSVGVRRALEYLERHEVYTD